MRNIRYDSDIGLRLPREMQLRRLRRVMEQELTERQKQVLSLYFFDEKRPAEIARILGVHRSTALRTLRRAENRVRQFLKY